MARGPQEARQPADRGSNLVYSTKPGWDAKAPEPEAAPDASGWLGPPLGQQLKLRREKQGRAGKTVTTIFEFQASDRQREFLAKELRRFLGCGGTVKDGIIEMQGDQLDKIQARLLALGYKPRKSGG
jgi:translation initiation factor 1